MDWADGKHDSVLPQTSMIGPVLVFLAVIVLVGAFLVFIHSWLSRTEEQSREPPEPRPTRQAPPDSA